MYNLGQTYQTGALSYGNQFLSNPINEGEKNSGIYPIKSCRYAFNGMEQDKEVSGNGNSYTTQFRQYDPRLGRWKSLDPLAAKYASITPYAGMGNNPMFYTDPLGLEPESGDKVKDVERGDGRRRRARKEKRKLKRKAKELGVDDYTITFNKNGGATLHYDDGTGYSIVLEDGSRVSVGGTVNLALDEGKESNYDNVKVTARRVYLFSLGTINALGSNLGFGLGRMHPYKDDNYYTEPEKEILAKGQMVGDLLSIGAGVVEIIIGVGGGAATAIPSGGASIAVASGVVAHGATVVANGVKNLWAGMMNMFAGPPKKKGKSGGGSNKKTSPGQMQKKVERGQAPNSVDSVHKGRGFGEKDHIHFMDKNKSALNSDGTWKHGGKTLTNEEKKFLQNNGWTLPSTP